MSTVCVQMAARRAGEPAWEAVRHCLDVQAPWSRRLLDGTKTVETRSYPLPPQHEGRALGLLETPAGGGEPQAGLLVGTLRFGPSFRYPSEEAWAADADRHGVCPADPGAFGFSATEEKWGWPVLSAQPARYHVAPPPLRQELRSIFALDWARGKGRVFLRPGFADTLRAATDHLRQQPASSLLCLADFDRTLSAYAAPPPGAGASQAAEGAQDGEVEVGEECHDVLFHHAELGEGFAATVAPLLAAADADKDAASPQDMAELLGMPRGQWREWEDYAEWWWRTAHDAMAEAGLTRVGIAAAVARGRVALRPGVGELVAGLREAGAPLVVVSAGITDVIDALMSAEVGPELWPTPRPPLPAAGDGTAPLPPVIVHSNTGVFDSSGRLLGFEPEPPIHWLNKIDTTRPLAAQLGLGSKVVLLLGDSVKDVTMVEGLDAADKPPVVLRIGFLNTSQDARSAELEEHMAVFDACVAGDGPLDFVLEVLAQLWEAERAGADAAGAARL